LKHLEKSRETPTIVNQKCLALKLGIHLQIDLAAYAYAKRAAEEFRW